MPVIGGCQDTLAYPSPIKTYHHNIADSAESEVKHQETITHQI